MQVLSTPPGRNVQHQRKQRQHTLFAAPTDWQSQSMHDWDFRIGNGWRCADAQLHGPWACLACEMQPATFCQPILTYVKFRSLVCAAMRYPSRPRKSPSCAARAEGDSTIVLVSQGVPHAQSPAW
eukprot:s2238_g6.t1